MKYITSYPMIYRGVEWDIEYTNFFGAKWYFDGVQPKNLVTKPKRSKIGNDVWLGRNVIIINGTDIGNGVIAGASAVITKDIPDHAVVVGVPVKIIPCERPDGHDGIPGGYKISIYL